MATKNKRGSGAKKAKEETKVRKKVDKLPLDKETKDSVKKRNTPARSKDKGAFRESVGGMNQKKRASAAKKRRAAKK